jgi:hypothetical protein
VIDKRTQNALADLQREIHLLAEEIEHQRDRKAIAEKRDELDRKAHRIVAEFGMQDDRNGSGESKKETL